MQALGVKIRQLTQNIRSAQYALVNNPKWYRKIPNMLKETG